MGIAGLAAGGALDVRAALRTATAEIHLKMHRLERFRRIEAGTLALGDYRQLLADLLRFHSTVETALTRNGVAHLGSGASRVSALTADIEQVGSSAGLSSLQDDLPAGEAAALGCLYVAQGSTLGGRVIFRQLDYLFGSRVEGRSFFAGTPADAASWRRVRLRLQARGGEDAGAVAAMAQGALATFALFEACVGAAS